MTEREFAVEVVRTLQQAGFRALWAGGCVRDELLGLHPNDYDVATDARPEQVQRLFRRSIAVGAAFGVIEVVGPRGPHRHHLTVEVATFRSDGRYLDGRRPEAVTFSSPEEDAKRRDFTINGMFFDPLAGELHDFVGGRADLEAKVLRAIGDPAERFREDGLVGHVLKELVLTFTVPQGLPSAPTGTLWDHIVRVTELLEGPTWPAPEPVSFPLAFAALLHDVGKPQVFARTADRYTFH